MLIGKHITITEAKNKTIQGKKGVVLDETKNTLTLKTATAKITIIKDQITTITEEQS